MKTRVAFTMWLGLLIVQVPCLVKVEAADSLAVRITSLEPHALVDWRPIVTGRVSDRSRVWLLIRTSDGCWLQGPAWIDPAKVGRDYDFSLNAQFGEDKSQHSGAQYAVRALANPRQSVRAGRVGCTLEAEAISGTVVVVRK